MLKNVYIVYIVFILSLFALRVQSPVLGDAKVLLRSIHRARWCLQPSLLQIKTTSVLFKYFINSLRGRTKVSMCLFVKAITNKGKYICKSKSAITELNFPTLNAQCWEWLLKKNFPTTYKPFLSFFVFLANIILILFNSGPDFVTHGPNR